MSFIEIKIDGKVQFSWLDREPLFPSHNYVRRYPDEDWLIFYDWLEDEVGNPCALELHLDSENSFVKMLQNTGCKFKGDFPLVFFSEANVAKPRNLEAFGDIQLLETSSASGLIVVGTDTWLSPSDNEHLRQLVASGCR